MNLEGARRLLPPRWPCAARPAFSGDQEHSRNRAWAVPHVRNGVPRRVDTVPAADRSKRHGGEGSTPGQRLGGRWVDRDSRTCCREIGQAGSPSGWVGLWAHMPGQRVCARSRRWFHPAGRWWQATPRIAFRCPQSVDDFDGGTAGMQRVRCPAAQAVAARDRSMIADDLRTQPARIACARAICAQHL